MAWLVTQQQTTEADVMRGTFLSDHRRNEASLFQVLKPQLFLLLPCPLHPTPPPLLISDPYIHHIVDMFIETTSPRWPPPLSCGCLLCVRDGLPGVHQTLTRGASLHLCVARYQEPSLALCCLCSIPDDWLQLYLSSSFYYPLTNTRLLIRHVLSGLLTNGLLSACNTF